MGIRCSTKRIDDALNMFEGLKRDRENMERVFHATGHIYQLQRSLREVTSRCRTHYYRLICLPELVAAKCCGQSEH